MDQNGKRQARFELLFTQEERDALAEAAYRRRRTEASVVREALAEWIDRHRGDGGEVR